MKILHLATRDQRGGAARSTLRLHKGLRRLGIDSQMVVKEQYGNDASVCTFQPSPHPDRQHARAATARAIAVQFATYRESRPKGTERFSDDRSEIGSELLAQLPEADVVTLHWVPGFVDYGAALPGLTRRTPVVWRLSDLNPLTGGCHYDRGCERYVSGCGTCPQLGSTDPHDLAWEIWTRKRNLFAQLPDDALHLVAPSRWLATCVGSSMLRRFPLRVIPSAVDTDVFTPHDTTQARAALALPRDARVVLFIATSLHNERKGFSHVLQAMAGDLAGGQTLLVTVGQNGHAEDIEVPHRHFGLVENDGLLAQIYSAADVVVAPSSQDNLPLTVLESLACGTPVVGFATGGMRDAIVSGIHGELVPTGDTSALRVALRQLLGDPMRRASMRVACRRLALAEYGLDVCARRYQELYTTIVSSERRLEAVQALVGARM